jgi:hypothetical protein
MDAGTNGLKSCQHGPAGVNQGQCTEHFESPAHAGTGWPEFKYWPRFNSVLHQQMHISWLKRAWKGGLRLVVFHAVNNTLVARYFHADGQHEKMNDMESAKAQLDKMRQVVEASDFRQIATSLA